jgi:undecaprenyl-diphosphatase
MLDFLIAFDHELLFLINKSWTHPWLDAFFPWITDLHKNHTTILLFILVIALIALVYYKKSKSWIYFIGLLLAMAFTDFTGGKIIKPYFERLRPPEMNLDVIMRAPQYGGFSFISNHSANMFCLALFIFMFNRKIGAFAIVFASVIAYSRVYCGVHFPSDVIGGALWGSLIGSTGAFLTKKVLNRGK